MDNTIFPYKIKKKKMSRFTNVELELDPDFNSE